MQILITGGAGFIGAWLVRRLAAAGHRLHVLEPARRGAELQRIAGAAAGEITWHLGDITDASVVSAAATGCDAIIHLAGVLTPACKADPVRGAMIRPHDDAEPLPITHYGAFKMACEGSARAYWEDDRLPSVGLRPYIVYGFGRETGLTAGPSLACRAAARGEPYAIPCVGTAGLVFVDDVVAAYEAALLREPDGAHVFNLPGQVASNADVVEAIRAVKPDARIGIEGPILPSKEDNGEGDLRRVFPDLPFTSLTDGIRRTIELYATYP